MASSAAVVLPPPPKPLSSAIDDEDEEIEYEEIEEEIEVEEEVEIEEEIEEEEEVEEEIEEEEEVEADDEEGGDEDEIGEDLTPARQENQENDTNQIMELEEHEDHIQSGSVAHGIYASNPLMDVPTIHKNVGDVKPSKSSEKEELHVIGERTSRDNNPKAPFNDSGEVNHAKTTPFTGDVNASSIMAGASSQKDNANFSVMAETNHTAIEVVGNTRQMSPRLHLPQIRSRDPSSSAEFDGENKKLRIVCEFHAKGWCIRGNSCRFLHIKDGLDAVARKTEVLEREASSSACIPPQQSCEIPKLNSETGKLVLQKDDIFGSAPLQDDRGSFGHNLHLDNYSYYAAPLIKDSLTARNSAYHGRFSVTSHDNHRNTRIPGFGTTMEEMISKKSDIVQSDPSSADLPYSHPRQPLSFGSSSWNTNTHGAQNFWESGLEHRASVSSSLQQSIPPVSHSKSDGLSRNHNFRDTGPANYKSMFSSFDWEPSVPFRPSHVITQNLLLKESLYDPMRDSIDQKDVGDGRIKFSHSDQGSSVKDVNVQSNSVQEEEKLLNSVHAGDTMKDYILSSSCDDKLKFDKAMDEPILKVGGSVKNDETDVDFKRDSHIQSESKALKYFQSALIEFVKELLKPTWHKGFLSKDAYKLIVKKAVDKVLSTLQPHQIPSTGESIKLYLSSSQPKLAKLVEGYINKYGKS